MTDPRHADFEALSAYVDGEAPEWADHVEACASCRATAAQLRALAVAVAEPVAARSAAEVDRDVSAALDAVPNRPVRGIDRLASRRRSGSPWALGAVAAVVLAVLGFSGLVLTSHRQSDETATVVGPALQAEANFDARAGQLADSGVAGAAPVQPSSDLGDVGDAATLRSRAQPGVATGAAAGGSSATDTGRSSSPSNSGAAPSPSPNAATGSAGALTPTTTLNQRAGGTAVGTRPCEEQARAREPTLGPVVYFATARRGPVAGFVLGFGPPPGSAAPSPVTLLLLTQDGCAELLRSAGP